MSSFFASAQKRASDSSKAAASAAASFPLVANVSSAFERFSTGSPSRAIGESVQGGEPDSSARAGSLIGENIVCIEILPQICGGYVGAGGNKFCCKSQEDCAVAKHAREKFDGLQPGFYIKAGAAEAFTEPWLDLKLVGSKARSAFLSQPFSNVSDVRKAFTQISSGTLPINVSSDVDGLNRKLPPAAFFTPGRKRLKQNDLREKFDAVLESVDEEEKVRVKPEGDDLASGGDAPAVLNTFLKELTTIVTENQQDSGAALDKVHDVMSQLGVAPSSAPPTLWLGYMEHAGDLKEVGEQLKSKLERSDLPNLQPLDQRIGGIETQFQELYGKLEVAFNNIESQLQAGMGRSQAGGGAPDPQQEALIGSLIDKVERVSNSLHSMQKQDHFRTKAVHVGKHHFQTMNDLEAWMTSNLPPNFPFGGFVDVYSFLQRVKSNRDIVESGRGLVVGMEERRKSKLTADESLVVEAFSDPLPRCFCGPNSSDKVVWCPGVRVKQKWESDNGTQGVKLAIKDNLEGIRSRIDAVISQRLGHNFPVATNLARELLSDTVTFITAMMAFISNTFQKLVNAGYPTTSAWDLVSKLVYRMFATDCFHEKRGIATEMLDADDHRSLAVGILWATFGTHMVMRDYLKHDFADHPSISGEFTRFLVANAGVSKINKAQDAIDKLTKKITELEKTIQQVDKKATTASNKADEAHKASTSKKGVSRE